VVVSFGDIPERQRRCALRSSAPEPAGNIVRFAAARLMFPKLASATSRKRRTGKEAARGLKPTDAAPLAGVEVNLLGWDTGRFG